MEQLGTLEELIVLAVCALGDNAYGFSVHQMIVEEAGRPITLGAVHTTLYRLQDKGLLNSSMGGATSERGGRSKRLFTATGAGRESVRNARVTRERFWKLIPGLDPVVAV